MTADQLLAVVEQYLVVFSDERANLQLLLKQLATAEKMNDRRNFHGHITGGGIVLSPDKTKVLLIHHRGFNRWQQPGGHWESDEEPNPLAAAKREIIEETSAEIAAYLPLMPDQQMVPLDIDTHWVPTPRHAIEPPHYHHDFRYVFVAASETLEAQLEEVSAASWFALDDPACQIVLPVLTKLQL